MDFPVAGTWHLCHKINGGKATLLVGLDLTVIAKPIFSPVVGDAGSVTPISFGGDVAIEDESYALVANNGGSLIDPDPIVNARISYAPNGGNWNIALWGKNLTDEVYWKATTSPNVAYPIAPLTWGVDIRADF